MMTRGWLQSVALRYPYDLHTTCPEIDYVLIVLILYVIPYQYCGIYIGDDTGNASCLNRGGASQQPVLDSTK